MQFNVTLLLNLAVEVRLDLAATPLADIARHQMLGQVSEGVVVSYTEGLVDSVALLVSELVEHGTHIRHLIVVLHAFLC